MRKSSPTRRKVMRLTGVLCELQRAFARKKRKEAKEKKEYIYIYIISNKLNISTRYIRKKKERILELVI